jgi:hypothetical protein
MVEKTIKSSRYGDKRRARRKLAAKHGLPDMPYPLLYMALEELGVDTSKFKKK